MTARHACLNLEGGSRVRDYTAVGGLIGKYGARWGVTVMSLTEVPLRRGVEAELNAGLKPYGYAARCPQGLDRALGAAIIFPRTCTLANFRSLAKGRVVAGDVDLPSSQSVIKVTIGAAYCPSGGTTPRKGFTVTFRAQERDVAEAVLKIADDCRSAGRPLWVGTDANAIVSQADTFGSIAMPREESCISRWLAAGFTDTFRFLFPDLQVASYYATNGWSASRLDYILATAIQHLTPVGGAIHVGAVWPFDHHPVLTDFWAISAPAPAKEGTFKLKWSRFLSMTEEGLTKTHSIARLEDQISSALPFAVPESGPSPDGVV